MNIQKNIILFYIFLTALVFLGKLYYIQVVDVSFKLSAENNTFRHITQYPARGIIFDRNKEVVVSNEPTYDLKVYPDQLSPFDTVRFVELTNISKSELKKILKSGKRFDAVTLIKQMPKKQYARLQEFLYRYPDFYTEQRALRVYREPIAAHLLGYVGETNQTEIDKDPYYTRGDFIGKSGVERTYENYLRGQKGVKIYLADVHNRLQGSYANGRYDTSAVAGKNITLSIDGELQYYGEQLMKNKIGGVVAIEPASGEILALISSPSYDPSLFVGKKLKENYNSVANAAYKPLYNRALKSRYPPGSTFKAVNALIGFEKGVINPNTVFTVYGYYAGSHYVNDHIFGPVNFEKSIQFSSNAYYCHVFGRILNNPEFETIDEAYKDWKRMVQSMGLGVKLGTDLAYEDKGLIYPSAYFDKYYGKGRWNHNTLISLAFGQGELGFTPLQLANMGAVIANEGFYYKPHIVKSIEDEEINQQYKLKYYAAIDQKHYPPLKDALEKVVSGGTARSAYVEGLEICGKTGTAQNPHGEDHSIFFAFAPKDKPKIVVSVYVENAGYGSTWAAPIASMMIEKYLTDTVTNKWQEKRIMDANLLPEK